MAASRSVHVTQQHGVIWRQECGQSEDGGNKTRFYWVVSELHNEEVQKLHITGVSLYTKPDRAIRINFVALYNSISPDALSFQAYKGQNYGTH